MINRVLDKRDSLISIGKSIYKLYDNIDEDKDNKIQTILTLMSAEKSLLESLELTNFEVRSILDKSINDSIDFLEINLPLGLFTEIDENSYPYCRLMAHLHYWENDPTRTQYISTGSLVNTETAFLYNELLSNGNKKRALYILMNSPMVEKNVLENGLEPFSEIYDTLDWEVQLRVIREIIFRNREGIEVRRRDIPIFVADGLRISFYINKLLNVSQLVTDIISKKKDENIDLDIISAYLNSLFALLDEEDLKDMKYSAMNIVADPLVKKLLLDSFSEDSKLLELKRKVQLVSGQE